MIIMAHCTENTDLNRMIKKVFFCDNHTGSQQHKGEYNFWISEPFKHFQLTANYKEKLFYIIED